MQLTKEQFGRQVQFTIEAEVDDIPVRGNVCDSGDKAYDKEIEDRTIERLEAGDIWAWAQVTVKGTWYGLEAEDHLGGCSYLDEEGFTNPGGYYDEMRGRVIDQLFNMALSIDEALNSEWIKMEGTKTL